MGENLDDLLNASFTPQSSDTFEPILLCKCLMNEHSCEQISIPKRKTLVLSTVGRTEEYLRKRRIPELIRFLFTKLITNSSPQPIAFLESLLDECMLFRAGLGVAPVLYEDRHLQAVIKSFDPGNRGWLNAGQVRRAFTTLGLPQQDIIEDKMPCDEILYILKKTQEKELLKLLSPQIEIDESTDDSRSDVNNHSK